MNKIYKNINTIWTTQKELNKLNKYFEINFDNVKENGDYEQQDLIDKLGAKQDDTMGLFTFEFENGKSITIDLDSGSSNYYDNIILWDEDGNEEFVFDCDFEFNSIMEFMDTENNETYICEFTMEEKKTKMKINGQEIITNGTFAYDGCHKIYICENKEDCRKAKDIGYNIFDIKLLKKAYENSCDLRFISNWELNKTYVGQFEDAVFEQD